MSVTVTYKGNTLTTAENETRTLLTAGKYLEGNIILTDVTQGGALTPYTIRSDAELVRTYTYDQMLVEDEGIAIPSYTTTAKTLKASASLSPTIAADLSNYDYRIAERFLAIPQYKDGTAIATGRLEYWEGCVMYDLVEIPANSYITASGKAYTSRTTSFYQSGAFYREFYWSSTSAVTVYSTNSYGIYMVSTAPSGSTTLTIKSPALTIRGHATYFRSAVWSTIEDIRYQYVIEVYRAPRGSLNIDGWGSRQLTLHILNDINNNDGTLT